MPPIRSQTITQVSNDAVTLDIDTTLFGLIKITLVRVPATGTVTATIFKAGVQHDALVIPNATIAQLESWCQLATENIIFIQAGGQTIPTMNCRFHVFSLSPLNVTLASFNHDAPIPAVWWGN